MDSKLAATLRRAMQSVRAGNPGEAMRALQEGMVQPFAPVPPGPGERPFRLRKPMADVLAALRAGRQAMPDFSALSGTPRPARVAQPLPPGAQFVTRSFAGPAGARSYRLYIPAAAAQGARGLVVMLHGCKQDADDFAAGTGMNARAEEYGLVIAYPNQSQGANPSACWNWFNPADQTREAGEPAIIAGMTRALQAEFSVPRDRTFVAGLSAGAAMAVVMGETHPDLYAAVGAHSGLAYRSANDAMSAFAAMRGEVPGGLVRDLPAADAAPVRMIIFQGRADGTVHPSNAERIAERARSRLPVSETRTQPGSTQTGRSFSRTTVFDRSGIPLVDCWMIDGAGHAWAGGHAEGSYTDPSGPDASAEMVRFFLASTAKE
ncbi:extracellular catalytic domain type 1 short-chain-length polyhydroxyalkanoate depolymerase [Labrys monachus]|uniref:Poly(Hydroxyalkanoate) depolymerase family esterase n=1 Tax=Labrys monachus TaxID=217067 RepID=A0ABU0FPN1_9HYPH|nr:PHB depolymerase family esterase [Labrys monachus]MDQ0396000.1 poly(hydroxyalkanoate) depolymerase family esterase [Labrys monachus]